MSDRSRYAMLVLVGLFMSVYSIFLDEKTFTFTAGLILGMAIVAFDRECKRASPRADEEQG